jgi:hypothetical protein
MATIPTYMTFKGVKTPGSGIIKTGVAASEIPFGAFVTRSADGTIKAQISGTPYNYLGVAVDDQRQQMPYDGFYAAGKKVPYIATGTANVWLLGGQTINAGDFVKFPTTLGAGTESLGVVIPEATPATRTASSVGRVLETYDAGDADYDQPVTSFAGSVVTFNAAATIAHLDLVEGDYVVIDSDEAAEVNRVVDPLTSDTTITMEKDLLASHAKNITMYKLVQIEVELI